VTEGSDSELSISVAEPLEDVFVVSLVGDLDIASSPQFSAKLAALRGNSRTNVIVDVAGVGFIDSNGLNALVTGARAVEANDGSMVVAGPAPYVARVFELVRMAESVEVVASLEEALSRAEADTAAEQRGH
jgi:anti-sigma B factor antagonist